MNSLFLKVYSVASACALATSSIAATAGTARQFATPEEAINSLIQAAENFDPAALKEILGPGSDDLVSSNDATADKNRASEFAAKAKQNAAEMDPKNPNRAVVVIGDDRFPLPIPLVKANGKWHFDVKAGRNEILAQRIGANELDAIEICRGLGEAQKEYAQDKHDGAANQYAKKIVSTDGKQDGLSWKNAEGIWAGPVGELAAKALAEGYSDQTKPYHGYYFKFLTGQGEAAPLGQMEYMINGKMAAGFAIVAAPADYRVSGVKTFIVSHDGVVYEKDLGPSTLKAFQTMERYNPDKSWARVEEQN